MVPPTLSGTRVWHLAGFFCASLLTPSAAPSEWPVDEGEDEWWFPEKLLGRADPAQSPPEVSLVTLQARPALPAVSRGAFPTFSTCSDLGHAFEPPAALVQNFSVDFLKFYFPSQRSRSR